MKLRHLLIVGLAAGMMSACADYGVGVGVDDYAYGPPADVAFDGWYDGFYGPIYDGYWDNDIFYYRTADTGRYQRGDVAHFRHNPAPGYSHITGTAHARTTTPPPRRHRQHSPG